MKINIVIGMNEMAERPLELYNNFSCQRCILSPNLQD